MICEYEVPLDPTFPSTGASASPARPELPLWRLRSASALRHKSSRPEPVPYRDEWSPRHRMPSWRGPGLQNLASKDGEAAPESLVGSRPWNEPSWPDPILRPQCH